MVAATSLWATAFIAPVMLPDADALDITIGRYLCYGLCSIVAFLRFPKRLGSRYWLLAIVYALFGNVLYYLLLTVGIRLSGAAVAVPVIGLLPVTVAIFGNFRMSEARFAALAFPLLLTLTGITMINLSQSADAGGSMGFSPLGLLCLVLPVVMWTWYAVSNAAFLKNNRDISSELWASATGVGTLFWTILLIPARPWITESGWSDLPRADLPSLAFWSIVLGVGASWGAAILFNKASKELPVSLAGQMIVFETLFGILYVFLAQGRYPRGVELIGFLFSVAGIWLSIRVLERAAAVRAAARPAEP